MFSKGARQKLQEEILRYKAINKSMGLIAEAIPATNSLSELYRKIHLALEPVIDTTNIYFAHYDQGEDSLSFPYVVDTVDLHYPKVLNISQRASLTAHVIVTQAPLLIRREEIVAMRENSQYSIPDCSVSEIWVGVPLKTLHGIIGVIAVQSYTNPDAYDDFDIEVLLSVADMVAIAIERKRAEDALKESEEKYRRIVTTVREGILSMDTGNRITFVNRYLAEILGYTEQELLGQPFDMLLSDDEIEDFYRRQTERRKGCSENFERKFRTKNGEIIWAIISASPIINPDGEFTGSFGSVTNITDRKNVELALKQKNIELQDAMDQIKTLQGILPICMHCKKIRDDRGYWNQVEVYLRNHTSAEFSHGLCPECMGKYYPEYDSDRT